MSLEEAQIQLENALSTTFLANLSFLNEYDNKLFQRVDSLSQLISNGTFNENYCLEFLQEDGDFDIYDIKNDKYLYNKKPSKFNRNAYHKTDFTSKGSISILDQDLFQGRKFPALFDEVEYFCNFDFATEKLANDIYPYVNVLKNNIGDFKFKKYRYINKFIFVGTMLGRHIPLILKKTDADNFFVCEKNLEIFRLSLFVVDYSDLARDGKTVVFSIMDDSHIFNNQIERFLTNKAYENHTIKYFTTDYNVSDYFDNIVNAVLAQKSTTFNYHMMLENLWKNVSSRINKYKILQLKANVSNSTLDIPVLFLGAGPSLNENIEWVKENQDKFLIVAMGATYKILLAHGIKASIVTTLDPQYSVLNKKHFDIKNVQKIEDIYVFAAINTDQRILDRFNQEKLYLFEMAKPLHSDNICYKGFSVGEITASIILGMGFKNIYLLGLDFAINQKTGSSHTESHSLEEYYSDFLDKKHKEESNSFTFKEELIEVKGNFIEKVYSNRLFVLSLNTMSSNLVLSKKDFQKIYNLSNHGAYIENTIPTDTKDIILDNYKNFDKKDLSKDIEKFLLEISKDKLSSTDQEDIKKELKYLLELEKEISTLSENSIESFDKFNEKIELLISKVYFPKVYCSFLHIVFIHFFNITLQYIYYCFNNQKFKNEDKKIKEIEKIFYSQTSNLLTRYISYLKQI